jgi:SAM-dependent methyltransferase
MLCSGMSVLCRGFGRLPARRRPTAQVGAARLGRLAGVTGSVAASVRTLSGAVACDEQPWSSGGTGQYTEGSAAKYAAIGLDEGNFWLIHHHAEAALRKWLGAELEAARAVDWGCGAGRSCQWLRGLGLREVHGADVCREMLEQARINDPGGRYELAERGRCPFESESYDLVLSMVVLIEMPTADQMRAYAAEAYRMLRPGGIVVATSATEESHDPSNKFVSFRYFASAEADPHNKQLRSGDRVVCRNNSGLCMEDYYWSRPDIVSTFALVGFRECEVSRTLGSPADPFEWQDEMRVATDYVFVFRK